MGIGVVTRSLELRDVAEAVRMLIDDLSVRQGCLDAIEAERSRCLVDNTVAALLRLGGAAGWRSARPRGKKLAAMDAMHGVAGGCFVLPFDA